jgi:hypothetical protein
VTAPSDAALLNSRSVTATWPTISFSSVATSAASRQEGDNPAQGSSGHRVGLPVGEVNSLQQTHARPKTACGRSWISTPP